MPSKSALPCIVWFRDDLRLSDHPALRAASKTGQPVICLYVFDEPSAPNARPLGGAARWWLAQSLRALQQRLNAVGASLLLRKEPAAKIIPELARTIGADAVFWNEIAQAPHQALAGQVAAVLKKIGVASQSLAGDLLAAPADIRNKRTAACAYSRRSGGGCRRWVTQQSPLPAPDRLCPGPNLAGDALESWHAARPATPSSMPG
jgi:deoxyribodipyrimidine photo-lyase